MRDHAIFAGHAVASIILASRVVTHINAVTIAQHVDLAARSALGLPAVLLIVGDVVAPILVKYVGHGAVCQRQAVPTIRRTSLVIAWVVAEAVAKHACLASGGTHSLAVATVHLACFVVALHVAISVTHHACGEAKAFRIAGRAVPFVAIARLVVAHRVADVVTQEARLASWRTLAVTVTGVEVALRVEALALAVAVANKRQKAAWRALLAVATVEVARLDIARAIAQAVTQPLRVAVRRAAGGGKGAELAEGRVPCERTRKGCCRQQHCDS
mmetsp:Transcript_18264/g.46255  ORF Transcript_18264/g.46255 Transcript_18264/m.46255 type:complete len:272 (-) Transcript_18264:112-927(-)